MFENYRKKLFCIKYNINYKKNQEVKPNRLICVKFYYTTKETSKYRCESKNGQGGMPLFVLEITPGSQMIS